MTTLINDPQLVADLASQAMAEPAKVIITVPPSSSEVELPGGFITSGGFLVKYAEIRELNGSDEEAIAKSGSIAKALDTILQRGLVSLGGEQVKSSDFDSLLMADRDALLLAIRKITFGELVKITLSCSSCAFSNQLEINLSTDVPVEELKEINDRRFIVKLKSGTATLSLPNGLTHKKLMEAVGKTTSEITTVIIAGCLSEINNEPSMGITTALNLSISDREIIINEIYKRNPGPRLGEVFKVCEACGTTISIPLGLADLFRL